MSIFDDVNKWEKEEGANIFSSILNVNDPVILDYGCGAGNYSFVASFAFEQKCKVYAVDINKQCLDYVNGKAKDEEINCITTTVGREDYRHDFDDDFFDLFFFFELGKFQNILNGFLLSIRDETAGVDNHHLSQTAFGGDLKAGGLQFSQHQFGIHLIFGASQGYHTYLYCHGSFSSFCKPNSSIARRMAP